VLSVDWVLKVDDFGSDLNSSDSGYTPSNVSNLCVTGGASGSVNNLGTFDCFPVYGIYAGQAVSWFDVSVIPIMPWNFAGEY
jgi:hypothetical protein